MSQAPEHFMPGGREVEPGIFNDSNSWTFNGQRYYINVQLHNTASNIGIPPSSIVSLSFTESIYSIFPSIELVIDTSSNIIDNMVQGINDDLRQRVFYDAFNFNSDGRETFLITMAPIGENNTIVTDVDQKYLICGWYYIYDEEEVLLGSGTSKQKTFFLRDIREQKLLESNIQWSSADVVRGNSKFNYNLTHLGNSKREAKTGTSIRHLLNRTLDGNVSLDTSWDDGETSVFYCSPSQSSAYDDLEYMLDRHVSAGTQDNCILKAERNGQFSLLGVDKYFELGFVEGDISPLICDIFTGESGNFNMSNDPDVVGNVFPGHGLNESELLKFDGLDSFNLLHTANTDRNNELVSTAVHSYDTTNKQFNIECDKHHISSVQSKSQELYADKMPGLRGNKKASAIVPVNIEKYDNVIHNHAVGPSGETSKRLYAGINQTLKKSLYFSPSVNFETPGSSHRTTCRFILLTLRNADKDAPLTKLIVGEWFTSKINHSFVFAANAYVNNITCIKPHSNEPIWGNVQINPDNFAQEIDKGNIGVPAGTTDLDTLQLNEGEVVV